MTYEDEDYTPELGDTVTFEATGDYGDFSADGEVIRVFKNGKIQVEFNGQKYKTDTYYLLSRAG